MAFFLSTRGCVIVSSKAAAAAPKTPSRAERQDSIGGSPTASAEVRPSIEEATHAAAQCSHSREAQSLGSAYSGHSHLSTFGSPIFSSVVFVIRPFLLPPPIALQGFFRMIEAKRAVVRRRERLAEEERERSEYEKIEESLEGMHAAWMRELLAIRAQKGVRAMLARK